ncbi:SseB family protein [Williamsia sp. M5A3_1d]
MDFHEERAAFFGGYGETDSLMSSLREQRLFVPLDTDEQLFTLMFGDVPWMVAFTSVDRLRAFSDAAGRDSAAVRLTEVAAGDLIDRVITQGPVPSGLVVDAHSSDVMVFPPDALNRVRRSE